VAISRARYIHQTECFPARARGRLAVLCPIPSARATHNRVGPALSPTVSSSQTVLSAHPLAADHTAYGRRSHDQRLGTLPGRPRPAEGGRVCMRKQHQRTSSRPSIEPARAPVASAAPGDAKGGAVRLTCSPRANARRATATRRRRSGKQRTPRRTPLASRRTATCAARRSTSRARDRDHHHSRSIVPDTAAGVPV